MNIQVVADDELSAWLRSNPLFICVWQLERATLSAVCVCVCVSSKSYYIYYTLYVRVSSLRLCACVCPYICTREYPLITFFSLFFALSLAPPLFWSLFKVPSRWGLKNALLSQLSERALYIIIIFATAPQTILFFSFWTYVISPFWWPEPSTEIPQKILA